MALSISFSSGAVRGYAYIGVLKALLEANVQVDHVLGSSIGAFACLMYVLNYSISEMKSLAHDIDVSDMIEVKLSNFALDDGYRLSRLIRAVLLEKGCPDTMTFLQLFEKFPKKMTIIATDVIQGTRVDFDHEKTPDASVAMAVRASMSVPLLFAPVHDQERMLVDGAVSCFLPEATYSFSVDSSTPCILLEKPDTYQAYIARLIELFFHQSFRARENTCVIPCNADMTDKKKYIKTLIKNGYKEAKGFIERWPRVDQTILSTNPPSETCTDDRKKNPA